MHLIKKNQELYMPINEKKMLTLLFDSSHCRLYDYFSNTKE
jgi:hypothetical protein